MDSLRTIQNKLQVSYSRKEKLDKLSRNLEELKKRGEIDEERYNSLKEEYKRFSQQAENTIGEIKENLKSEIKEEKKNLELSKEHLKNLETRFKVGEIAEKEFEQMRNPLTKKIEGLEKTISELEKLISSKNSADLGGYLEVKLEGKEEGNLIAILSYFGILFLVPLLAFKDDEFCQFHAKQGLVLFIAEMITGFILMIPILGWIVGPIALIVWMVLTIIGIINVLKKERALLPIIGKFAERW